VRHTIRITLYSSHYNHHTADTHCRHTLYTVLTHCTLYSHTVLTHCTLQVKSSFNLEGIFEQSAARLQAMASPVAGQHHTTMEALLAEHGDPEHNSGFWIDFDCDKQKSLDRRCILLPLHFLPLHFLPLHLLPLHLPPLHLHPLLLHTHTLYTHTLCTHTPYTIHSYTIHSVYIHHTLIIRIISGPWSGSLSKLATF
jgi:hypothetical protein